MAAPAMHDSAVLPCFQAAWLSSTGISHHNLLPHIPSVYLCSQQQPSPWDCSTIPTLQFPAATASRGPASLPGVHMAAARSVWFSFRFRLPQISCFTLSLKCFSSDPENCPDAEIGPCFSSPTCEVVWGPVLLTLSFLPLVPSSYRVLCGSVYSFLVVMYCCLLSAGILQALLCLKVYSWCIHGERCTSHPTIPLPSRSLRIFVLCLSVILACSFLFVWYLSLVLILECWWTHRMSLEVFLPLQLWEVSKV